MRKYKNGETTVLEFTSIIDMVQFIQNNEVYPIFKQNYGIEVSRLETEKQIGFTKTKSFDEALDLLLHGWEHGTKEIKNKVESKQTGVSMKQKSIYDVAGFQCSVPRYLQGIPTNMINKKAVPQKNKIVTINKSLSYGCKVQTSTIIEESVKALQLVNRLEKQGYRVNLNYIETVVEKGLKMAIKGRIKDSSQRLNIKQVAFPLIHPSMLRRILFAVFERCEECAMVNRFKDYYGFPFYDIEQIKKTNVLNKGEIYIPPIVSEKEIIETEPYVI